MLLRWYSFKVVLDSADSDWLAWLYPSPYTVAHRFGIVRMVLNGVFKQVDVNENFLKTMLCAQCYFFLNGGGAILVSLNTLLCVNVALTCHHSPLIVPLNIISSL